MCGIIGFSGKKGEKFDKLKVATLYMYNLERGTDATGIWSPTNGVIKDTVKAGKFLKDNMDKIEQDCLLIGHTRQGSLYKTSKDSAHPFADDKLVLAHNGTLINHDAVARHYDLSHSDYKTDTEALFKVLSKEFKTEVFTKLNGSASLLIADKGIKLKKGQENSFLLAFRLNDDRPLHYGFSDEGMYISSLEESLEVIGCKDIKEFAVGTLYTIFNGDIVKSMKVPHKPLYSANNYHGGSSCNNNSTFTNYTGSDIRYWQDRLKRWIKSDRDINDIPKNSWFFLDSIKNNNLLNVITEDGESIETFISNFYYSQPKSDIDPWSSTHKFVVAMDDLSNDKKIIAHKGDVLQMMPTSSISHADNSKTFTVKSLINGVNYQVTTKQCRLADTNEAACYNILDEAINEKHRLKIHGEVDNTDETIMDISLYEESHFAQYLIESCLLTTDEFKSMSKLIDSNKDIRECFDMCENAITELNEAQDTLTEEIKDIADFSIVGAKAIKESINSATEKIGELFLKNYKICKKQLVA